MYRNILVFIKLNIHKTIQKYIFKNFVNINIFTKTSF